MVHCAQLFTKTVYSLYRSRMRVTRFHAELGDVDIYPYLFCTVLTFANDFIVSQVTYKLSAFCDASDNRQLGLKLCVCVRVCTAGISACAWDFSGLHFRSRDAYFIAWLGDCHRVECLSLPTSDSYSSNV